MFEVESVALIGFAYICILFCIAYFGDSDYVNAGVNYNSNLVYALSLAVYCSSWTFYGAVGTAVTNGLDYLAIYLGPCLVFLFGYPVMRRIIMICKQNSITSISDFISSRYGKDRKIGILVTVIAVVGSLPYIALQLKAVSSSYLVLISKSVGSTLTVNSFASNNIVLFTGASLALFTILFGTRHLDTTEHHKGMVLAIAFESIVKLLAILAVGYYAIYLLFNNEAHEGFSQSMSHSTIENTFSKGSSSVWSFATKLLLAISAIILLPRQFQVTVVEARDHRQFKTAMWVMPIYLILTSIIVIPIALTGSVLMPNSDADLYVLTLPLTAQNNTLALVAFIGGLSAATGMVIVAAISLSTMVCNDLVMPYLISHKRFNVIKRDNLNDIKKMILSFTNPNHLSGTVHDAIVGADVFIGVSAANLLTTDHIATMAEKSIVFALANPDPEIMPEEAYKGGALVVGTGRSDLPNQVNNVLGFPGIFRGALDAKAKKITPKMKLAAAFAIADCIKYPNPKEVIPATLNMRVASKVAEAVKIAALEDM